MSSDAEAPATSRSAGGPPPQAKTETLHKLGRYDIERKLGAGGMGAVYLARDTKLRRQVALKVLPKDKANNPILVRRFEAEAQAAAQLRHDNIVAVYDSGKVDGYLYIAMEYVDGIDLHELVSRRGTIPVKRSIEIIKQAASALEHAGKQNIVHRDIKPSNLLIRRDGAVKITDLGLARSIDDSIETGITRVGTTVGTVDYMAPEQARSSKAADIRSDLYSLGCTWYQMLTGSPPYPEGSLTNKLQAHAVKPLPDPRTVNPNVTDALVAILHRMMAKKPEDRYQTPAELLKDLESPTLTHAAFSNEIFNAIEQEEAEAAREEAPDQPAAGPARKRPGKTSRVEDIEEEQDDNPLPGEGRTLRRTGPMALPPPRRQPVPDPGPEEEAGNLGEKLKLFAIVGGLVAVVAGLSLLISSFSGVFDSPAGVVIAPAPQPPNPGPPPVDAVPQTVAETPVEAPPDGQSVNPTTAGNPPVTPPVVATVAPAVKIPDDLTKRPDDLGQPTGVDKLPVWTVGLGQPSETHFTTLNEALSRASEQAVSIKLIGSGPYLLTNSTPLRTPHLHLVSDDHSEPLIVLSNGADGAPARLHVLGDLSLVGVHLVIDRQASPVATPFAMIAVENGNLSMQRCSLTALQTGTAPLTAISVRSGHAPPRVSVVQSAVRGEFDVGFELHAPSVDFAVADSLIAVGHGTAVRLRGEGTNAAGKSPVRLLRSFQSTWQCRSSFWDFAPDGSLDPPPAMQIALIDTIGCTGEGGGPQMLLNAGGWSQSRLRELLLWKNDNSALLGFETLIDFGAASSFKATDAEGWKSFWRQAVESHEFNAIIWPKGLPALSLASPGDFGRDVIPVAVRKSGVRGVMPGVPADRLSVPESVFPERMAALAKRAPFTGVPWSNSPAIKVDIREQDLGLVLAKGDWPERTVIEASGYGVCRMSPVVLTGRQVKVVFRQEGTGPLRLVVKEPAKPADALFQVRDGALELEGLRWQVLDVKASTPKWLVAAIDSKVILRDCELNGPDVATTPFEGIVRFETASNAERPDRPQLALYNSFLHAPGSLIRVDAAAAGVFAHNTILGARGVALDVRPKALGDRLPLTFDLVNCTVSAQQAAIRVTSAAELAKDAASPSRWFVDNCVWAPPIELKSGEGATATVLTYTGPVLERKELEWWGRSNGAAKEIRHWLRPDGSLPKDDKTDLEAWKKTWGEAHELHPLTGDGGVILREPLPARRDQIQIGSFALRPSCKALVWAEGRPIGAVFASPASVGPQAPPKSSPAIASPATTPSNSKTTKPSTKKTPGF